MIRLWSTSIRHLKEFEGHDNEVRGLSFSPTDNRMVSGSDDLTVRIWDLQTGKEENILKGHLFDVKKVDWLF